MAANPHNAGFVSAVLQMLLRYQIFLRPSSEEVITQKCTRRWFCQVCRESPACVPPPNPPVVVGKLWLLGQLGPLSEVCVAESTAFPCEDNSRGIDNEGHTALQRWWWRGKWPLQAAVGRKLMRSDQDGCAREVWVLKGQVFGTGLVTWRASAALRGWGPHCAARPRDWRVLPRGLPRSK